jgi:tRNA G18 (ribose-2'-O)-methylase SpoU
MDSTTKGAEEFFHRDYGTRFYANRSRPVIVGIDLQTPANIGGLIRLAGNTGCRKVIITGDESHFRNGKIRRAASNAYGVVDTLFCDLSQWREAIPEDYTVVAVETAAGATDIYSTPLPEKIALVVGNERFGLPDEVLSRCDKAVYIPMPGHTLSMNVVQAAAVATFEWLRQVKTGYPHRYESMD